MREGELLGLHYVRVPENGGSMAVASCKCVSADADDPCDMHVWVSVGGM